MLAAIVLLPFAPVAAVAVGTVTMGVVAHVGLVLDNGASFTNPVLLTISVGLSFLMAVSFQGRTLWRAFRRGLSSPLAELPTRDPDEELASTVQQLAVQAGVEQPRLRVVETETPEAFTVRDEDGQPTIAVSESVLDALDEEGKTAVLAHEVAHLQSRDVTVMRWATLPLAAADEMRRIVAQRREEGELPFVGAFMKGMLASYGLVCAGVVATGREYAADAGAAALTGDPAALASALATLDAEAYLAPSRDLRERSDVVALNVVPAGDRGVLSTHPPTSKRIERLQTLAGEPRNA